jgi:hypothetical protein
VAALNDHPSHAAQWIVVYDVAVALAVDESRVRNRTRDESCMAYGALGR